MSKSRSFKQTIQERPNVYRTPSPPRDYYEFYSTSGATGQHALPIASSIDHEVWRSRQNRPESLLQDEAVHTQALDLSEAYRSPASDTLEKSSTSLLRKHDLDSSAEDSRSAKRSKSEKLHSPPQHYESFLNRQRPITSYNEVTNVHLSDAELLVNFSQRARKSFSAASPSLHEASAATASPFRISPQPLPSQSRNHKHFLPMNEDDMSNAQSLAAARLADSSTSSIEVLKGNHEPPISSMPGRTPNVASKAYSEHRSSPQSLIQRDGGVADIPEQGCEMSKGSPDAIVDDIFGNTDPAYIRNVKNEQDSPKPALPVVSQRSILEEEPLRRPNRAGTTSFGRGRKKSRIKQSQALAESSGTFDSRNLSTAEAEAKNGGKESSSAVCASCHSTRSTIAAIHGTSPSSWIGCDGCKEWFHFACAGFSNERDVRMIDKYRCGQCKLIYGPTTYVRKSSRAHAPIDYAGLHQGVIKTSDDRPEHHYIQPIKDGTLQFLPDNFARMNAKLITANFFEEGGGMTEPIVIPAALNNTYGSDSPYREQSSDEVKSKMPYAEVDTTETSLSNDNPESTYIPDHGQDDLDMVIPKGLTVRLVAQLYGPDEKIEVIDVKSQNGENRKWSMQRWVDYYENRDDNKIVRNVISLEVSQSRLGRLIKRPRVVRDLDLQDSVWPKDLLAKGEYPHVQFYCLMSVADCFTDFHIDFGGSSVFYHIIKGKKTFFFIPPKEKHLKKYEEWCMSPSQNWTFLPSLTKECYRVDLTQGDTMLIPAGWIHAVWTPEDSLVLGGNFLTRLNYAMQIRIEQVEKATGVARKFRYPQFQTLHWYVALDYLAEDPVPPTIKTMLLSGQKFKRKSPTYQQYDAWGSNSHPGPENHHARYYSKAELDGLPELLRYLLKAALIDSGHVIEGISTDTRLATKRAIPRGHGSSFEIVQQLALWSTWKRGNEQLPHWAYSDTDSKAAAAGITNHAVSHKLDEEAAKRAQRRSVANKQVMMPSNSQRVASEAALHTGRENMKEEESHFKHNFAASYKQGSPDSVPEIEPYGISAVDEDILAIESLPDIHAASSASELDLLGDRDFQGDPTDRQDMFDNARWGGPYLPQEPSCPDNREVEPSASIDFLRNPGSPAKDDIVEFDACVSTDASHDLTPTRSRSKACNECRKSKRRCIHDANGHEDPNRMNESAIPRPHARKMHKLASDEHECAPCPLQEQGQSRPQSPSYSTMSEGRDRAVSIIASNDRRTSVESAEGQSAIESPRQTVRGASTPQSDLAGISGPSKQSSSTRLPASQASGLVLASPPASLCGETISSPVRPDHDRAPASKSSSRQGSSNQPKLQSLCNESTIAPTESMTASSTRHTSHDTPHKTMDAMTRGKSKSRPDSTFLADEESMKLIKAIQAEEKGLRRR